MQSLGPLPATRSVVKVMKHWEPPAYRTENAVDSVAVACSALEIGREGRADSGIRGVCRQLLVGHDFTPRLQSVRRCLKT